MATLDIEVANGVISRAVALQLCRVEMIYKFKSEFLMLRPSSREICVYTDYTV